MCCGFWDASTVGQVETEDTFPKTYEWPITEAKNTLVKSAQSQPWQVSWSGTGEMPSTRGGPLNHSINSSAILVSQTTNNKQQQQQTTEASPCLFGNNRKWVCGSICHRLFVRQVEQPTTTSKRQRASDEQQHNGAVSNSNQG